MEGSPATDWVGEEPTPEHFLACPTPRGASQGDYGRELVQLFPVGNGPLLAGSISSSGEQALLGPAPSQPLPAGGGKGSAFLLAEEGVPWPGSAQPLRREGNPCSGRLPLLPLGSCAFRQRRLRPVLALPLPAGGEPLLRRGPVSAGDWPMATPLPTAGGEPLPERTASPPNVEEDNRQPVLLPGQPAATLLFQTPLTLGQTPPRSHSLPRYFSAADLWNSCKWGNETREVRPLDISTAVRAAHMTARNIRREIACRQPAKTPASQPAQKRASPPADLPASQQTQPQASAQKRKRANPQQHAPARLPKSEPASQPTAPANMPASQPTVPASVHANRPKQANKHAAGHTAVASPDAPASEPALTPASKPAAKAAKSLAKASAKAATNAQDKLPVAKNATASAPASQNASTPAGAAASTQTDVAPSASISQPDNFIYLAPHPQF